MDRSKNGISAAALLTMPLFVVIFLAGMAPTVGYTPKATAIGHQGLTAAYSYTRKIIITNALCLTAIPLVTELAFLVYRKASHNKGARLRTRAILSAIAMVLWVAFMPPTTGLDVLAVSTGCKGTPIMQTAQLCYKLYRDVKDGETTAAWSGKVRFTDYRYSFTLPATHNSPARRYFTNEYCLTTSDGGFVGVLSQRDVRTLDDRIWNYGEHEIQVYKNSHIISSIDGFSTVAEIPHDIIHLDYDPETGTISRELLCDNEEELPQMLLIFHEEGKAEDKCILNGRTEFYFKREYPCSFTIRAELNDLRTKRRGIISNIVEYTVE